VAGFLARSSWIALLFAATSAAGDAFPGAEGYGRHAMGGRYGRVYRVSTLADSGAGSLRECVEACGPRTCVFDVSGTIDLESGLVASCGFLTIAGQTSPGGVQLRNVVGNTSAAIRVDGSHVVIRYMRFRPGPGCSFPYSGCGGNVDGATVYQAGATDVILDHCSFQWAADENVDVFGNPSGTSQADKVTVQWSIIAEPLDYVLDKHQGYALLLIHGKDATVHHNLISHYRDRAPNASQDGILDFVNNVIHKVETSLPLGRTAEAGSPLSTPEVNYRANYGTTDGASANGYMIKPHANGVVWSDGESDGEGDVIGIVDETSFSAAVSEFAIPTYAAVAKTSAAQALVDVVAEAGAVRRISCAGEWIENVDALDARILSEHAARAGVSPDHPDEVGGWPVLSGGAPCADSDGDGMPDEFESRWGFDAGSPDGSGDRDADGYTNLEEFLNGTDPGQAVSASSSGGVWVPASY